MTPADTPADPRRPAWWSLAALGAVLLGLGAGYLAAVPPLEGHDAFAHFAAVARLRATGQLPRVSADDLAVSYELVQQPPLYYLAAALATSPWALDGAQALARTSRNPHFGGPSNYRQTITLPRTPSGALPPLAAVRLLSLMGGLLALVGAWWAARRLVPGQPSFALAVSSVTALNPHFLYLSTTIGNDAWAAGTAALALACAVEAWARRRPPAFHALVGAAYGLAALVKYSCLLLAVPLALLWLLAARREPARRAAAALAWAVLGALAVAGWWYARNLLLYGELVPVETMARVIGSFHRSPPYTVAQTLARVPWLLDSYWGVFVALIAPAPYLALVRSFTVVGLASAPLGIALALRREAASGRALLVPAAWAAVVATAVLHWTRTVSFGEQGRLAGIGSSALAFLVVLGWQSLLPSRWHKAAHRAVVALMLALAAFGLAFLHDRHAIPRPVPQPIEPDRHLEARFAGGMRLLGLDLPAGASIDPGTPLPVRLYLTTDQAVQEDFTLFVHLADAHDRKLFAYDGAPARGRHPTRGWRPGEVWVDELHVVLDQPAATPTLANLTLGFYRFERPDSPSPVVDDRLQPLADRLSLARVRVRAPGDAPESPPATDPPGRWSEGIELLSVEVAGPQASPQALQLVWRARRTLHADYTVFVHALDADNRIVHQSDRQPRCGDWPTSTWRSGDIVSDPLDFALPADAPWARIVLGLYAADGRRLPLVEPPGGEPDALTILRRP